MIRHFSFFVVCSKRKGLDFKWMMGYSIFSIFLVGAQ